ncbi:MAG: dihydrolipoyl dehydrogenase [Chloroflexota bacterium]
MNSMEFDLVIVGSGPGGYIAAVRASQLGMKVACVERSDLGGVCLNWGCIPTKALLKSAEVWHNIHRASEFGFNVENVSVNFDQVIKRSRDVAGKMSKGVGFLFKKYKIEHLRAHGKVKSRNLVELYDKEGNMTGTVSCKNVIIATGARPRMFPGIEVDRRKILTSTEAMIQKKVPQSMIVMGAGAIGVEFAYFFSTFGTEVTIIEMMDRILPVEDSEVSKELERNFRKSKIKLLTSTRVVSAKTEGEAVKVVIQKKDGSEETLTADLALNAIGIQANIENLGLEEMGVAVERGFIKIDEMLRTNVEGVYAIGDVAGPPWLAHKASAEGITCVEHIAGKHVVPVDYANVPGCTYCHPQVASVGLTEEKARAAGHELKIGKFPFTANGKANGIGEPVGFIKLIFDAKYGELLGAHMIGPDVTELIAEMGLARSLEATGETIFKTIHAHPTLSEAAMEAAALAYDECANL